MRGKPQQVRRDALEFGHHNPDILGPLGDLDIQELFNGQDIGQVIADAGGVVQAIGEGDGLGIRHPLGQLLHPPVQVPYVGDCIDNPLTVELQDQP